MYRKWNLRLNTCRHRFMYIWLHLGLIYVDLFCLQHTFTCLCLFCFDINVIASLWLISMSETCHLTPNLQNTVIPSNNNHPKYRQREVFIQMCLWYIIEASVSEPLVIIRRLGVILRDVIGKIQCITNV